MVKTRHFFKAHQRVLRIAVISLWLLCTLFSATSPLFAQQQGDMDSLWEKVQSLLSGPFGKAIAAIGFVVGAISIFLGNMQLGIGAILGALIIAFAPIIINFLFD